MPEGEVEERRRRGIEYRTYGQTPLALAVKGICVESGRSRVNKQRGDEQKQIRDT